MIKNKEKLNILKSVEQYEDLPKNSSIGDFTFIESLDIGVIFTENGWRNFNG